MLGMAACAQDTKTETITVTNEVFPACDATHPTGQCDAGQICFEAECVDSATLCSPTNLTGACTAGTICFAGGCVLETALCSPTAPTGPCELGSVCVEGMCVATASLCSSSNPTGTCAGDLTCIDGICGTPEVDPCSVHVYTTQPTVVAKTATSQKAVITVDGLQFKDLSGDGALDPYEDWRLLEICRAKDLVSKMSIPEKVGTMSEGSRVGSGTEDGTIPDNVTAAIVEKFERYALIRTGSRTPQQLAVYLNNVQELAETQPWGIPVTITADPIHGFGLSTNNNTGEQSVNPSSVVSPWPYPLGLGAINDPVVTRQYGDTVRREFRAMGFTWQLGPMADIATEPRWARVQNTFGVNAYAVAMHTRECIAGFQGTGVGGLPVGIAATMKHFPGAGADEDGMDSHSYSGRYNVYPGGYFEYHQIAFQAAIDAGVAAVMPCYSIFKDQFEYDPEQLAAGFSATLITDYLKEEMGFTGMVTGDWGTLGHKYNAESIPTPLRAAMWLWAGSHQFGSDRESNFQDAYDLGYITEADIDGAVEKILEMSFKLGLFENPYVDPAAADVRSAANLEAGFIAQKKAIVLLANAAHEQSGNQATKFLPIDGSRYKDANDDSTPQVGEYLDDTNNDGTIKVWFDGVVDRLVADPEKPDDMTSVAGYGEYDYTAAGSATSLPIVQATGLADADIAILRISARKGSYFGLDAGVPLSFDGAFPGQSNDGSIRNSIQDRNRVIDAFRARDGYTDAAGTAIAATNPNLRIVLVMHFDRPGIVKPFINGLTTLDELPGEAGSYPLVSDEANIEQGRGKGVDAFLVEFGAIDRAVLDFVFNQNVPTSPEGYRYGEAVLPMEIPSSDAAVEAQFEDVPADTVNPTYKLGSGSTL
jgi:beta-glucosidase